MVLAVLLPPQSVVWLLEQELQGRGVEQGDNMLVAAEEYIQDYKLEQKQEVELYV